jgi:glutathione S-transferase
MKVYDAPIAPNPRRVRWVMAEKGISDIEVVPVSIPEGEHKRPDYLAKAGLPNLPMLEMDDGTTITESLAICRYLESRYPEPNLFGRTPEEVAVIEMWTRRAEMMVATPFMLGVRHSHPGFAALEAQDAAVGQWNQKTGLAALAVLDRRLGESQWLGADRLTIADIVAFIGIDFARIVRLRPPEELTHVTRWAEAMRERPAAKA